MQTGKGLHGSLKKRPRQPVFRVRARERSCFASAGMDRRAWGLLREKGSYIRVFGACRPVASQESKRSRRLNSANRQAIDAGEEAGSSTDARHVEGRGRRLK